MSGIEKKQICTGCDHVKGHPLGCNPYSGEPYLACCPDSNYLSYILESEHDRIVSELKEKLSNIEQTVLLIKTSAQQKSWANEDRPMSEAVIEAEACIQVCDEILKQLLK